MRRLRRIQQKKAWRKNLGRGAVVAGTAAAITLGAGIGLRKAFAGPTPDPHQLPVKNDADADLLADREESAIGYLPFNADQNRNGAMDGVELARRSAAVIAALPVFSPWEPRPIPPYTYKVEHALDGLEQCEVCGVSIHMGGWEIINPRLPLHYPDPNDPLDPTFLPDLAIHYMTHGSFDCRGSRHTGRVNIPRLLRVIELRFPYDPNEHQLAIDANDLDGDLLTDLEEMGAGYNLYDPDQDDDLTPDGIELASQCADLIDELPVHDPYGGDPPPTHLHKQSFFQKGIEQCQICGKNVNMGYWLVVNPQLDLSVKVYDIFCHYMSHGSFNYYGNLHGKGRVDVLLLLRTLQMPARCGDLGTLFLPSDFNKDCRADFKDFCEFADEWLDSTDPRLNGGPIFPTITYRVENCGAQASPEPQGQFSVRVEGPYLHFEDMISANCCPDKIELEMTLKDRLITIFEKEYLTVPCRCWCEFPTTATLGPFDDGTYKIEVYLMNGIANGEPSSVSFVGETSIIIDLTQ